MFKKRPAISAPIRRPSFKKIVSSFRRASIVVARPRTWRDYLPRKATVLYVVLSTAITALVITLSFGIAQALLLRSVDYAVPNATAPINMASNILGVDATLRTVTLDWTPVVNCKNPISNNLNVNIFFDQNLLDSTSPGYSTDGTRSVDPPTQPTFNFNATQFCLGSVKSSTNTFRTVVKLLDTAYLKSTSSLQAYPYDEYFSQLSIFALDTATNQSVVMDISQTWGVVVNFQVFIDQHADHFSNGEGTYLVLNVSRSRAVKLFVICIILANWTVTIAFLWITVACLVWHEEVVTEMFALPIGALFAFTSVRSNMPGSPSGFGCYVDFVGILPNLVVITVCGAVLILVVLVRRILREPVTDRERRGELQQEEPQEAGNSNFTDVEADESGLRNRRETAVVSD